MGIRQINASQNSLIEMAKANDIEPYAWLKQVFTDLPKATRVEEIEALLPIRPELASDKAA